MPLIMGLLKGYVLRRVIREVRKPHNQQRMRSAVRRGRGGPRPR